MYGLGFWRAGVSYFGIELKKLFFYSAVNASQRYFYYAVKCSTTHYTISAESWVVVGPHMYPCDLGDLFNMTCMWQARQVYVNYALLLGCNWDKLVGVYLILRSPQSVS